MFISIGAEDSLNYTPSQFLNEICEYRSQTTSSSQDKKSSSALTFGWLLQTCLLSDIPMSCEFITFLSELQDSYSPIRVKYLTFFIKLFKENKYIEKYEY